MIPELKTPNAAYNEKFKNFQISRLSKYGLSLISIQFPVESRHSVHDGLLLIY
jgi:hypothetical protein